MVTYEKKWKRLVISCRATIDKNTMGKSKMALQQDAGEGRIIKTIRESVPLNILLWIKMEREIR